MENVDIEKLVNDIKAGEKARRKGEWETWAKEKGKYRWAPQYAPHMTSLYTLRAFLRGRMHRKNPPPELRDYHRSMIQTGHRTGELEWDMEAHNRRIAEKIAESYQREEVAA